MSWLHPKPKDDDHGLSLIPERLPEGYRYYVLIYPGTGVAATGIHYWTGSRAGHVACAFARGPRREGHKIEALANRGVVAGPITLYDAYDEVVWREYRRPLLATDVAALYSFYRAQVGKDYDNDNIWRWFLFRQNLTAEERQEEREENQEWHCSELPAAGGDKIERPLLDHMFPYEYAPAHCLITRELVTA